MLFTQDRRTLRRFYADAWRKYCERTPLEPVESMVGDIIALHPEYHRVLSGSDHELDKDYLPENGETNPYLHLSLHAAIREQVSVDRPAGIRALHQQLTTHCGDVHTAEHMIMECLAESLWQAQRQRNAPDEAAYLNCVRRRLSTGNV